MDRARIHECCAAGAARGRLSQGPLRVAGTTSGSLPTTGSAWCRLLHLLYRRGVEARHPDGPSLVGTSRRRRCSPQIRRHRRAGRRAPRCRPVGVNRSFRGFLPGRRVPFVVARRGGGAPFADVRRVAARGRRDRLALSRRPRPCPRSRRGPWLLSGGGPWDLAVVRGATVNGPLGHSWPCASVVTPGPLARPAAALPGSRLGTGTGRQPLSSPNCWARADRAYRTVVSHLWPA